MDLATVLQNAQNPSEFILFIILYKFLCTISLDLNIRTQAEAYLNQAVEAQYVSDR